MERLEVLAHKESPKELISLKKIRFDITILIFSLMVNFAQAKQDLPSSLVEFLKSKDISSSQLTTLEETGVLINTEENTIYLLSLLNCEWAFSEIPFSVDTDSINFKLKLYEENLGSRLEEIERILNKLLEKTNIKKLTVNIEKVDINGQGELFGYILSFNVKKDGKKQGGIIKVNPESEGGQVLVENNKYFPLKIVLDKKDSK